MVYERYKKEDITSNKCKKKNVYGYKKEVYPYKVEYYEMFKISYNRIICKNINTSFWSYCETNNLSHLTSILEKSFYKTSLAKVS